MALHSSHSLGSSSKSESRSESKGKSKSKGKGKGKEESGGNGGSSTAKSIIPGDPYAGSLSNRAGLDRFVHEPAYEAAWNPVEAASSRK